MSHREPRYACTYQVQPVFELGTTCGPLLVKRIDSHDALESLIGTMIALVPRSARVNFSEKSTANLRAKCDGLLVLLDFPLGGKNRAFLWRHGGYLCACWQSIVLHSIDGIALPHLVLIDTLVIDYVLWRQERRRMRRDVSSTLARVRSSKAGRWCVAMIQ